MNTPDTFTPQEKTIAPPPPVNAAAEVTVNADGLHAYIQLKPPANGGNSLSLEDLKAALARVRVTFGVDENALKSLAQNPVYGQKVTVASGIAPIDGVDGTYQLHFDTSKEVKFAERSDGTIDYYNLNLIENVQEGQVLCTIVPATDGTNGTSVTNGKLGAKNGRIVPNLVGKHTLLNEEGTQITAAVKGYVTLTAAKIEVHDTLIIKEDVGISTGNIKALSSVTIFGTVLAGFSVESEGNVTVHKIMSGGNIIAKGDMNLKGGMVGSTVSCGGALTSKFIENCQVFSTGNIKSDYIMHSKVQCGGNVQAIGSIGKIVGGTFMVAGDISARTFGSDAGIKTYLEIGTDPSMIQRQQELTKLIPEYEKQVDSLRSLWVYLSSMRRLTALRPINGKPLKTHGTVIKILQLHCSRQEMNCSKLRMQLKKRVTAR